MRRSVERIKVRADLGEVDRVLNSLRKALVRWKIDEEDGFKIELSLYEICVNVILYAYPERQGSLEVRFWTEPSRFHIEVRDRGVPFDPRSLVPPDIRENIRTRKKGGLGVYLVRTLMDGFAYKRDKGVNILTVYKSLRPRKSSAAS
jgi:anti-sigma regulatory factor (Ser/Thr protein kinase)